MIELHARLAGTQNRVCLRFEGVGTPLTIAPSKTEGRDDQILSSGWIDLQVNGLAGTAFNSDQLTTEAVHAVTRHLWSAGVGQYCPTLITDSPERLERSARTLAQAANEGEEGKAIVGIHLEGPFISPETGPRGAHPLAHVRPPDRDLFRRLQDAAEGLIVIVTLAPELAGALRFIEWLREQGVIPAIGHTAASSQQIHDAVAAGALLATHVGNAAHHQLHRLDNYVYAQLADDGLMASFIADGHHVPRDALKVFLRAKTPERSVLVSDVMHWSKMAPGVYRWEHLEVEVTAEGKAQIVGEPRLAGSTACLDEAVARVVELAGWDWDTALGLVSTNPRRLLQAAPRAAERLAPESYTLLSGARPSLTVLGGVVRWAAG